MKTTTKKLFISIFSLALLLNLSSCKKEEGFGGEYSISGDLSCDCILSNADVYINFGGKDDNFPDADSYAESDYNLKTDAFGNFVLDDLNPGEYYFYCQYTDENGVIYEGKEYVNAKKTLTNKTAINLFEMY
jgi:hypothetical protein